MQALIETTPCVLPEVSVEEQGEKVGDTGREFSETSVLAGHDGHMMQQFLELLV